MTGSNGGVSYPVTSSYVAIKEGGVIQGSYLYLPVMQEADQITVDIRSIHSSTWCGFASLTELEIYVNGKADIDRYAVSIYVSRVYISVNSFVKVIMFQMQKLEDLNINYETSINILFYSIHIQI